MFTYGIIFSFGLILGSFLNVLIYRIPRGESIVSRGLKISSRCVLVVLLTGMASVVLFSKYGMTVDFVAFLFLIYILIVVFFIDLEHQIIPNELVIAGLAGGVILYVYARYMPFLIYSDQLWWNPLLGLVSGSGFLLGVAFVGSLLYKNQEVMGMGDVKLFAPIGLFLGWRMTLLALFISVILGGMTSLMLNLFGKASRKSRIPFGPFIVIGVFITVMWGWDLLHWYITTYLY